MYDKVSDGFLSLFLLQQRVVAAEHFHREPVVCHVEHGAHLVAQIDGRHVRVCRLITRYGRRCPSNLLVRVRLSLGVLGRLCVEVFDARRKAVVLAAAVHGRVNDRFLVETAPAGPS